MLKQYLPWTALAWQHLFFKAKPSSLISKQSQAWDDWLKLKEFSDECGWVVLKHYYNTKTIPHFRKLKIMNFTTEHSFFCGKMAMLFFFSESHSPLLCGPNQFKIIYLANSHQYEKSVWGEKERQYSGGHAQSVKTEKWPAEHLMQTRNEGVLRRQLA